MGDRAFYDGHIHHCFLGSFNTLAYAYRNFLGLAKTVTDLAIAVAHNHERTETEAFAALYDLCNAVDVYNLVDQLIFIFFLELIESSQFTTSLLLELQPALTCGI
jgi:poly-gamma-glutamate capsule biosynthesis protein CapA/YwtB (metallophosphatase superfamily)